MTQENNEQIQALTVQALWVAQAVTVLMTIAMIASSAAQILKVGVEKK